MQPKITVIAPKILVGKHLTMSMAQNKTGQLWGSFMPHYATIPNKISGDKFSLQVYPSDYFVQFQPMREFVKWAAVEVSTPDQIPEGMEQFDLAGGTYAVFEHKGSSADPSIFQYIYAEWLPQSSYQLADLPHFELLGDKYKINDPESEEEIWIPVREK